MLSDRDQGMNPSNEQLRLDVWEIHAHIKRRDSDYVQKDTEVEATRKQVLNAAKKNMRVVGLMEEETRDGISERLKGAAEKQKGRN